MILSSSAIAHSWSRSRQQFGRTVTGNFAFVTLNVSSAICDLFNGS
jgi:hypothetical protein